MRVLALLARIIGWLLTPFVVWAASFLGAWMALATVAKAADPRGALITTFVIALLSGAAMTLLWRRLLRRSPKLRASLQVTPEGLPDLEPDLPPPPAEPTQPPPERPA